VVEIGLAAVVDVLGTAITHCLRPAEGGVDVEWAGGEEEDIRGLVPCASAESASTRAVVVDKSAKGDEHVQTALAAALSVLSLVLDTGTGPLHRFRSTCKRRSGAVDRNLDLRAFCLVVGTADHDARQRQKALLCVLAF
jgi:hypothetical protein